MGDGTGGYLTIIEESEDNEDFIERTRDNDAVLIIGNIVDVILPLVNDFNNISFSGIPLSINFCFKSSYTLNFPSLLGVDKSQNTNCVDFLDGRYYNFVFCFLFFVFI